MIVKFNNKTCTHIAWAGGKGASLARLMQSGFPVPPGFVVGAAAFEIFLQENELGADIEVILKRVKHEDINLVDRASREICALIEEVIVSAELEKEILEHFRKLKTKFVAVRSSATAEDSKTASWAGELETYLNVTRGNIIESVKKCWVSLFTPRAIFYRFEKGLYQEKISVAVVVQKMIASEVSGVCFTVHPVTRDKGQMVIEACFGLGEALVSGQITPDTYVIHKKDLSILEVNVSEQEFAMVRGAQGNVKKKLSLSEGRQQKLNGTQIQELVALCAQIEKHYRHPQDIEWAFAYGRPYILQSRPITTL